MHVADGSLRHYGDERDDRMANMLGTTDRQKWAWVTVVGLVLISLIAIGAWLAGGPGDPSTPTEFTPASGDLSPTETPAASPVSERAGATPVRATPPPAFSTPRASAIATPVNIAGATPYTVNSAGVPEDACEEACLVRIQQDEAVLSILAETGERPSYQGETWAWAVISRETVDRLQQQGAPVYLVSDSSETLYLYVTRLPEGQTWNEAVGTLGEVLDSVNGHSIVRAGAIPPIVTGLVDAGIWIEKFKPARVDATPGTPAGTGNSLTDYDVGVLLPEVDVDEIWQTVVDLQAMSSTDGTGIGTRQYSRPGNVMTAEYLFTRLESYGLNVWYEDFITWDGYLVSNVIGEIPGRDESMVYGVMAHLDSTAESFDEAPGADDNASGVAGALEIARILSGYELEHSVHVIFVNAEETMIIGSMAYAAGVVQNGTPIEGIFNLDTIGNPAYGTRLILNSGPQSAWMTDLLIRMNEGYGLGQDIRAYQSDDIVADDNMLRNQGIEAVLVARLLADDYTVHHTSADTIENMSFENTVSATQLVLISLAALLQ